jgi:hypothetical protein
VEVVGKKEKVVEVGSERLKRKEVTMCYRVFGRKK